MSVVRRATDGKALTTDQCWDLYHKIKDGWLIARASVGVWIDQWFEADGPWALGIPECKDDPYQWLADCLGVKKPQVYRLRQHGRLVLILGDAAREYKWLVTEKGDPLLKESVIRPFAKLLPQASEPVSDETAKEIIEVFHEVADDAVTYAKANDWKNPSLNAKVASRIVKERHPGATFSRSVRAPERPSDRPLDIKGSAPDDVFHAYQDPAAMDGPGPVAPVVHGSAIYQQRREIANTAFDLASLAEGVSSNDLIALIGRTYAVATQEAEKCKPTDTTSS